MIDKPEIVRHAERCSIICMSWETQQRRECKFPFYDYFRKVDGILFSYANVFFPSGHLKDHIKIALVFYHCQTDNHKLGSSKQHPFIISPLPQVRSLGVGELGLPCFPWSGVWVWWASLSVQSHQEEIKTSISQGCDLLWGSSPLPNSVGWNNSFPVIVELGPSFSSWLSLETISNT